MFRRGGDGQREISGPGRGGGDKREGRLTFDKRGFEVGGPYDLALALHGLPAFSAGDDSLDGVVDAAGGGDGVGEVVGGGDVDVLGEVVAVVGGHGGRSQRVGG